MNQFLEVNEQEIIYNLLNLKQLVFEVTDSCNLRCKYCGYSELYDGYDVRNNSKLPFYKAQFIIDYLCELWSNNIEKKVSNAITISFYGGEPLLNIQFIDQVINYLKTKENTGKIFFFSMTTNAILLDRNMDFLVANKFNILISLDGDKKGQSYRVDTNGCNSFDKVFNNIQLLRLTYPDYFDHFVNFNSVLHNRNSVESSFYFIKNNFGKEPVIVPLNNSGIKKDMIEEFNKTYRNYTESILESKNCDALSTELFINNPQTNILADYIYTSSGNIFNNFNELIFDKEKFIMHHPTGTCIPFARKMFITVNGKILQCEKINHDFLLGEITEYGVNLVAESVANQHNKYISKYLKQCNICTLRRKCKQCVFQIDDLHEKNTTCLSFMSESQYKKYIDYAFDYLDKHPETYNRILKNVTIRG